MPNLTISAGLDNTKLEADIEVLKARLRDVMSDVRANAREANAPGGDRQPLLDSLARAGELRGRIKEVGAAAKIAGAEYATFGQKAREAFNQAREAGEQATSGVNG